MSLRVVEAVRYITSLREGGSLPALVETAGGGRFVVKLRGAGQGPLALVAEIVVGEMARTLGLRVPEIALVELDPAFARTEPDPEIQDLFRADGVADGVAGCLYVECGPHAAQRKFAVLARSDVAD